MGKSVENNFGLARLLLLVILTPAFVSGVFIFPLDAATYYVAVNGSDAGSGTDSQPFRNIRKGLSVLKAGDTLLIKSGTYAESIDSNAMRIPAGTSWSSPVTIAAQPGHTVILKPSSGGQAINLAHSYIQYLIFDRLIIDAVNVSQYAVSMTNGAHHVRFQNGEVKNSAWDGIILTYGSGGTDFNQFVNMKIHDTGRSGSGHGIYLSTNNNLVERCQIYNSKRYGVQIYNGHSTQRASGNVIRSNKISGSQNGAITVNAGNNNLIYNNLLWGNVRGIDVMWKNPASTQIYYNTIYNNRPGAGIEIGGGSSGTIIKNNIVFQNASAIINNGSATQASNNLTSDPLFSNAGVLDFTLRSGSPAIGAAVAIAEVLIDFLGNARTPGPADIGAFQFNGSASGPSLPSAPTGLQVTAQ